MTADLDAAATTGQQDTASVPLFAYDSASYVFPDSATHVFEYSDGGHTPADAGKPPMRELYPFVHDITVFGGTRAYHSQFTDFEEGNSVWGVPGRCRAWVEARLARGWRAVPYCDRYDLARLRFELGPVLWSSPFVEFWIPTLDHNIKPQGWTQETLAADIARHWHVTIPAHRLWGNQEAGETSGSGGNWDRTKVWNSWN